MHIYNMCANNLQKKKISKLKILGIIQRKEDIFWQLAAIFTISITVFFLRKTRLKIHINYILQFDN